MFGNVKASRVGRLFALVKRSCLFEKGLRLLFWGDCFGVVLALYQS